MIYRLSSLCPINSIVSRRCAPLLNQKRLVVTIRPVQKVSIGYADSVETFEDKNARLKRPLSPHLTIYKPQITSMLSITHRITGCVAFGSLIVFAGAGYDWYTIESLVEAVKALNVPPAVWYGTKVLFVSPLVFHTLNGIRHLVWDTGAALTNKAVVVTGYAVIVGTVIFSLLLANE